MESSSISSEPLLSQQRPPEPVTASRFASFLNLTARRRGPSIAVRETAARQIEERRADWAYSLPVVAFDIVWNLSFAFVSLGLLLATLKERPNVPVRVWIAVYAVFCIVHSVIVWLAYRRRAREGFISDSETGGSGSEEEEGDVEGGGSRRRYHRSGFAKTCESLNTLASFLWWVVGFYWVVSGGEILMQNAPGLYWLAIVFLAFDVVFTIFCLALACMVGVALCCCLPCIIAILYSVAGQKGASDADLGILPRYKFTEGRDATDSGRMIPIVNDNGDVIDARLLAREDAECCICLTSYEDGVELNSLPCTHHFHSGCIIKWLRMHATCPLCKYNILKGSERV